jgi:hypothetical protein
MVTQLLPANVDYSDRDFAALKLRLQGLIRSVFPKWTNFNKAGWDNIILESFCYIGDVINYYQDRQMRELFWPTVSEYSNAIRLGRLIGYRLSSAQPATGTARFRLSSNPVTPKVIPYGTRIRTPSNNPVWFRTMEVDPAIPVTGDPWVDVAIEQSTAVGYRDPTTGVLNAMESFISTGSPNQKYTTLQSPAIFYDNTARASFDVEAEDLYQEVVSFLDDDPLTGEAIGPDSRVFVAIADASGRAVLVFGNGKTGKIPEGTVYVVYSVGGGTNGNLDAGEITLLDSSDSSLFGVTVSNVLATSGGTNRITILQARSQGPKSLRVLRRCVTKEDFEIKAEEIAGVARAVMVTSNEDAAIQENAGTLLVVAKGEKLTSGRIAPATPSSTILAQVLNNVTVNNPPPLTFAVAVAAAPLATINISTRIYLASGISGVTVGSRIREALNDFFAVQLADGTDNTAVDFGANIKQADGTIIAEIAWSDIFNVINDTTGVRKIDEGLDGLLLNGLRQSIVIGVRQFPKIGTVSIYDMDAGAAI